MSTKTPRQWMPLAPNFADDYVTRLFLALALFLIAGFVVFTPAWLIDTRILDGSAVWTKPQKFNVSLALHFFTLAVLAAQLPREVRTGRWMTSFAYLAAAGLVFEFVYVAIQASRGRRSHFNFETTFEALMYAGMGIGAVLLIAIALVMAIQIWRKGDRSPETRGLRWGTILGLSLGFITTMIFAQYMSNYGRYVGGELGHAGSVVPFFGWSREFGDLRPAHFISLHLMQTLPIAGYFADRFKWPALPVVLGVGGIQLAIAIALFAQALSGRPFWPV